jgi:hypothetical protein
MPEYRTWLPAPSHRACSGNHGLPTTSTLSWRLRQNIFLLLPALFSRRTSTSPRKVFGTPSAIKACLTFLAKLRWAELSGGSEKQFQDALRVFEVQHAALDIQYLNDWSARLGVEALWRRLQTEAEIF